MDRGYHYIRYASLAIYILVLQKSVDWQISGAVPLVAISLFGGFVTILVLVIDLRNQWLWRQEVADPGFPIVSIPLYLFYVSCFVWFVGIDPGTKMADASWYPVSTQQRTRLVELERAVEDLEARRIAAFRAMTRYYHDELFDFDRALELNLEWMRDHPGDELAPLSLAESYLTAGQHPEAHQLLVSMLEAAETETRRTIVARALEIVALVAMGQQDPLSDRVEALKAAVAKQDEELAIHWDFRGVLYYVGESSLPKSWSTWIRSLLSLFGREDRDEVLGLLSSLAAQLDTLESLQAGEKK